MRLAIGVLMVLSLTLTSPLTLGFPLRSEIQRVTTPTSLPRVYVDPSNITDPAIAPSENFTIEVKISNVTELYGFDIQLSWNTSMLNYTSHLVKIPVETYPDGVLHQPILQVKNEVNASTGTYIIVYSSLQAPSFNGSGIVFEMTFTVLGYGECALDISNSDLSNRKGQPIEHTVEDGYFNNAYYDVAVSSIVPSALNAYIGDTVNITVVVLNNGTTRHETFNVTVFYDDVLIDLKTVLALPPSEEETITFYWNTSDTSPGNYTLSANASILTSEYETSNNRLDDGVIALTVEPNHDIAITSMIPLKTVVFEGYCFSLNVTLENQGNFPETFNVTLYANNNPLNSTQITLDAGYSRTIVFSWETVDAIEYEDYVLNATADEVSGENDTSDNSLSFAGLIIVHPGDIDGDSDVDIFDIVQVAFAYGSKKGDQTYNANFDIDCNDKIDIFDIVGIASFYGYRTP